MKKAEIIIGAIFALAVLMAVFLIPSHNILLILSLTSLAMFYMGMSFALFNDMKLTDMNFRGISTLRIIGAIGAGIALAMTLIGILFKFMSYPGAIINLMAGLVFMSIVTIITIIKYITTKAAYYTKILKRNLIFGVLGLAWFLTPKNTWIEFKYRNHPRFAKAVENASANPNNKALQDSVDVERDRMYKEEDTRNR